MSSLPFLLLIATQAQTSAPADRADKFALDIPAAESAKDPSEPAPAPAPAPSPSAAEPAPSAEPPRATTEPSTVVPKASHFSLDTPIADLIADPAAKAVIDRDMPGLSTDENLSKMQALSLRRLAPLSGGQMTAELMNTLAFDLAALGGGALPPPPRPVRRKLPSGR